MTSTIKIPEWWIETTLGNLVKVWRWSSPRPIQDYVQDFPWIPRVKIADATSSNNRFINETWEFIKEEWRSTTVYPWDLIVSNSATPWIPKFMWIEACVHDWWLVFSDYKNIEKDYLYYFFLNYRRVLEHQATWTVFKNLKTDIVRNLEIVIPENPEEQKAIAKVLSSFDDKIELLRAENQTLEEMGQTLFKEWFGKYKVWDELPDWWRAGKLGEIIDFIIDNRWKTPLTSDKWDYPMVEINAIIWDSMMININDCKKFVNQELYNTWFRKWHPKRWDVLFSTVWSIWEITFVFDEIFCIAQNIVWLRTKYWKYFYLLLKSIQWGLKSLDISSVQPSIKLPHLLDYDVVIPDENIIRDFENKISPIFEKINNNWKQINSLSETRDQLLPKLMSWEVRVEF